MTDAHDPAPAAPVHRPHPSSTDPAPRHDLRDLHIAVPLRESTARFEAMLERYVARTDPATLNTPVAMPMERDGGLPLLHRAIEADRPDLVSRLLRTPGVDPNALGERGEDDTPLNTVLMPTNRLQHRATMLAALLDAGASPTGTFAWHNGLPRFTPLVPMVLGLPDPTTLAVLDVLLARGLLPLPEAPGPDHDRPAAPRPTSFREVVREHLLNEVGPLPDTSGKGLLHSTLDNLPTFHAPIGSLAPTFAWLLAHGADGHRRNRRGDSVLERLTGDSTVRAMGAENAAATRLVVEQWVLDQHLRVEAPLEDRAPGAGPVPRARL